VPIALIGAIALQTSAALWWASGLNTRVGQLETQYMQLAPQSGQIIRLQSQLEAISSNIAEIKSSLVRAEQFRIQPR
jgi:hypothetical protein